jgi:hypothetical protein
VKLVGSRMLSPDELHNKAKEMMLEGREPKTAGEWALCANFWAANISKGFAVITCKIMGKIYQCPLSEADLKQIAEFQEKRKA